MNTRFDSHVDLRLRDLVRGTPKLEAFFLKIAAILHLSYSLEILIKNTSFFMANGELKVNDEISNNNATGYALLS